MSITLIWAMAQNGVIGRNNQLPWRLPADLKFFKAQTMGKTMIMGRKTWESMGSKPLPGRHSVVLTQDTSYRAEGADVVHTLEEALRYEKEGEELMVIGGAGVFRFFLPVADKLLVTRIDEDIEGDVFFPSLNWEDFDLVHEEQGIRDDKNPYDYRFLTYERRK
ncbi:MAG: dihydrofolate reductase [Paenibacillus macerans]|uniref:dihydrofolate reductase n=1 Tax=Paenibacillus macerans TaxID=44252 RepID=UPI000EC228D4|nr:dihydrofolate reductase [Paenibacillus macerans]MBS5912225.1 dihydrofolate reductase [Paenibacillus macerans]MDU5948084.1 dihydrofolate reductase [Paenibacillus macerans]MDU7476547.1 dihydrofolate reductase [Paenibacillus macerans]GBK61827.1 dihydrofolate reductase [Paenibacillus macerans]GBK68134.1 dihydrofolate reductase [Paenibacillus macerans]